MLYKVGDYMKCGLCLAGGGIKGAAHIGAIKAIEEGRIIAKDKKVNP